MMKYWIALLLMTTLCQSQEIFRNHKLGFQIEKPADWLTANQNQSLENLQEQIKLPDSKIKELIQNNRGSIEIVTFYKSDIRSRAGIIPTIKIILRNNTTSNIGAFKTVIESSFTKLKETFSDFEFIAKPTIITVDGKDCVFSISTYTITSKSGPEKVRSYIYAIPVNNTFYQIAFMDTEKDDSKLEFEKALRSIKIN